MDSMYMSKPSRLWKSKADFFRPFRSAAIDVRNESSLASASDQDGLYLESKELIELSDLNVSLRTLVEIFPDADPATLRDMLSRLSSESRIEVVAEQVLRKRGKTASGSVMKKLLPESWRKKSELEPGLRRRQCLDVEDTFRGERYHNAVKTVLSQEFRSLSNSSIQAVMAENNNSYTRCRPVLHQLSTRTWRFSIGSLWKRRSPISDEAAAHPALLWQVEDTTYAKPVPSITTTGNTELDNELHALFIEPSLQQYHQFRLQTDHDLARQLNMKEAEQYRTLFDCECCYASVSFEELATCAAGQHMLCYDCIRRTVGEAIYGQGWARTVDHDRATIRCFAPSTQECQAPIPAQILKQALQADLSKPNVWNEYQTRLSSEALLKSRVPLKYCPSCPYAELDSLPAVRCRDWSETTAFYTRTFIPAAHPAMALAKAAGIICSTITILFEAIICILVLPFWLLWQATVLLASIYQVYLRYSAFAVYLQDIQDSVSATIDASVKRIYEQRRGLKFKCQSPSCAQVSCIRCRSTWYDPHICFEDEKTSLRTAIEASATAAVKRTCPRCMLSFVKSSGCNKLVCNCGYIMCYTCRAEITSKEGYAHFCQHFRPHGGRCNECDRCDLYGDEDQEAAIRQAAVFAEQEWRQKEAVKGQQQLSAAQSETSKAMIEAVLVQGRQRQWYERVLDSWIDARMVFVED